MLNKSHYREDPYKLVELSTKNSPKNQSYLENFHSGTGKSRSLLSQVHKLRKATGTPKRTIPKVSKSTGARFA